MGIEEAEKAGIIRTILQLMGTNLIEPSIEAYIEKLIGLYPSIKEIWLIGSRANNTARLNSDYDFIVFADEGTFCSLSNNTDIQKDNIDLMVVINQDGEFRNPWINKSGSLVSWEWNRISESIATYKSVKWIDDEEAKSKGFKNHGQIISQRLKAQRIWPR